MSKTKTAHGTIEVTAGDQTFTLKPTLRAFRTIEQKFGGVIPAMQALGQSSVTACSLVIAAGSGVDLGKRKEIEAVEEAVWEAGVAATSAQVLPFLSALLNPAGKTEAEIQADKDAGAGNE